MSASHSLNLQLPVLFSNAALNLYRHADANYLLANWSSVGEAEHVYAGLHAIGHHARKEAVAGLLTVMQEQDTLAPGALPTILNRYVPAIIQSGIKCFATVMPPRVYSLATAEIVLNSFPADIQTHSFHDVLLAHTWLREQLVAVKYG